MAVMLVVIVLIGSRSTIERYLHLRELRSDPTLVESWLLNPRLTPEQTAALETLYSEPAGRQAVFDLYLAEYDRRQYDNMTVAGQLSRLRKQGGGEGYMHLDQSNYTFARRGSQGVGSMLAMMNLPQNATRRAAVLALVQHCVGHTHRSERMPGFEFEVVVVKGGEAAPPSWADAKVKPTRLQVFKNVQHLCHFRPFPH